MSTDKPQKLAIDGEGLQIAIVASRYNIQLVNQLLESVVQNLEESGVKKEDIQIFRVPGSNELPYAASMLAKTELHDVIIALGVVIAGETDHHHIIAQSSALALQTVGIQFEVPVINGVLTVNNRQQALDRIEGKHQRGAEFASGAVEMARLNQELEGRMIDEQMDDFFDDMDWIDELKTLGDDDDDEGDNWKK